MSWLLGGRRQPSSAEKIAMMEMEMEFSVSMFDRFVNPLHASTWRCPRLTLYPVQND
jgi:hypothetical protein